MNTKERLGRIIYERHSSWMENTGRNFHKEEGVNGYDQLDASQKDLYGCLGLAVWQECIDEFTPAIAHYNVCKLNEATLAVALDKVEK